MQRLFVTCATAALTLQVAAPATQDPNGEEEPQVLDLSCLPRSEPEPTATAPPDLSRIGLVFDPLAPGGARPEEQEEILPVPVDPRTVTLFPVTPGDQPETSESEGKDLEEDPDCRP